MVESKNENDSVWLRVSLLFGVACFVETLIYGHLSAFTPIFLKELKVSISSVPAWTGVLASSGFILGIPLVPLWSAMADKYSRKLMIVRSSFLEGVQFYLIGMCRNVKQLFALRVSDAFLLGNRGIMFAQQADITPAGKIGVAIAFTNFGSFLGMSIGPYLGGVVAGNFGIRNLFFLDCILAFMAVSALIVFLPEGNNRSSVADLSIKTIFVDSLKNIWHIPGIFRIFFSYWLVQMGFMMVSPFIPIFVEHFHKNRNLPQTIGTFLTTFGVVAAISSFIGGKIGDRFGHLKLLKISVIAVSFFICLQSLSQNLWQLWTLALMQAIFQGAVSTFFYSMLATKLPSTSRSSILNLSLFPWYFAVLIAPGIGAVLTYFGLRAIFVGSGITLLLAFLSLKRIN